MESWAVPLLSCEEAGVLQIGRAAPKLDDMVVERADS